MKLTKFDYIEWQETPRMRWRLVGVRRFFTDFVFGVLVWSFLLGVVAGLVGLLVGSSMSRSERWGAVALGAVLGAAAMMILGWWPSSVRLTRSHLWYRGLLRGGKYQFSQCSSIRCDRYNGLLRLSLDMSPEAGWARQTIVFAAPVKRMDDILFLLNASGKFQDLGCLQG